MIQYPNINPTIIKLGPISLRWYGVAYIIGILGSFKFAESYFKRKLNFTSDQITNLMLYTILAIIIGGRLGYILIYDLPYYLQNPKNIFSVWQGGMSFHGGALGCFITFIIYGLIHQKNVFSMIDILGVGSTIGNILGRLANFINGELYGRITTVPWAMVFPGGGAVGRHPSQLYEAFFEGIVLFAILYLLLKWDKLKPGQLFGIYLFLYGLFRFVIEFFREPDKQMGYLFGWMTAGQLLCLVMVVSGLCLFFYLQYLSKLTSEEMV
ncbi:prolipoprotein diacylglyceryl transferase [Candidatus Margulisiibacteriota bacterium]